jgi:hypothetical protein
MAKPRMKTEDWLRGRGLAEICFRMNVKAYGLEKAIRIAQMVALDASEGEKGEVPEGEAEAH